MVPGTYGAARCYMRAMIWCERKPAGEAGERCRGAYASARTDTQQPAARGAQPAHGLRAAAARGGMKGVSESYGESDTGARALLHVAARDG